MWINVDAFLEEKETELHTFGWGLPFEGGHLRGFTIVSAASATFGGVAHLPIMGLKVTSKTLMKGSRLLLLHTASQEGNGDLVSCC